MCVCLEQIFVLLTWVTFLLECIQQGVKEIAKEGRERKNSKCDELYNKILNMFLGQVNRKIFIFSPLN